ncbi:fasciclin domain-containing protein [Alkalitalea saponilacus]|uniref:Fasciclin domain-containing protein n=1 Tax=Alkalitalea saponilacus TaxID=889453 RepID=A0A1T5CG94_9BACT|nr:fasciclin domain-containing protein [Alkalitalea saponilacus]ASB49857.1 hypothetical protein CDL62_12285 [Alkalitalea saponilacus]SKB58361.1 Fasciclin domain-containing protein [Alkalitalea saponilacus]
MKQRIWKRNSRYVITAFFFLVGMLAMVSCEDDSLYTEKEPEWLGESIYDYLAEDGNFNYYLRIIDDVGYAEVMKRTGSKTVFAANDEAFERFFQGNPWGVARYEELSLAQKNILLNFSSIDNAYLIETLANFYGSGQLNRGTALRRASSISVLDTVGFESGAQLPDGPHWDPFRQSGLYLVKDDSPWPLVHFLDRPLRRAGISDSDFELITGVQRNGDDAFIFDSRIIERDITCKNGYIHILEEVLVPRVNMAQHIAENERTTIFSSLLERFSAPYPAMDLTDNYRQINPGFNDTIYTKEYFSNIGGRIQYPDLTVISDQYWLPFNPGWNSYQNPTSAGLQADMGAIFAPTDETMEFYFNSGSGAILKDRYGNWENVPDDIAALLLRRHMRTSFLESVPARFHRLRDAENSPIPISTSDIESAYVGVNGVVYHTSNVYPPDDFISIYGPVLFSEDTRVFNWGIRRNDFRLYLNSLVSRYSFFVPTDEFFENYIDPYAFGMDQKAALKFWYNTETEAVNATVYEYDPFTQTVGDSLRVITSASFLENRLLDLLDSHIVIGDVESGARYYRTKGNNTIRIQGAGENLTIQGGGDIENGAIVNVTEIYNQENGRTYFIDKPIQTPLRSVYAILSETPEFSEFFNLMTGFPPPATSQDPDRRIFVTGNNFFGIDFSTRFFNTFHYTVYVPTNDAVNDAIEQGLISPWVSRPGIQGIEDMDEGPSRQEAIDQLERFIRYHFQDNSLFIGGQAFTGLFQTSTIKLDDEETLFRTYQDKYYRVRVQSSGEDLVLTTEIEENIDVVSARVRTDGGFYNIMARDYIFNSNPGNVVNLESTLFTNSAITTSSTAVIHQIDNVLRFE